MFKHVLEHKTGSPALCNLRPLQVLINIVTQSINEKTKIMEEIRRRSFKRTKTIRENILKSTEQSNVRGEGHHPILPQPLKFHVYVVCNNSQARQGDALFQKQPQRPMDNKKAVSCVRTDPQGWRGRWEMKNNNKLWNSSSQRRVSILFFCE